METERQLQLQPPVKCEEIDVNVSDEYILSILFDGPEMKEDPPIQCQIIDQQPTEEMQSQPVAISLTAGTNSEHDFDPDVSMKIADVPDTAIPTQREEKQ